MHLRIATEFSKNALSLTFALATPGQWSSEEHMKIWGASSVILMVALAIYVKVFWVPVKKSSELVDAKDEETKELSPRADMFAMPQAEDNAQAKVAAAKKTGEDAKAKAEVEAKAIQAKKDRAARMKSAMKKVMNAAAMLKHVDDEAQETKKRCEAVATMKMTHTEREAAKKERNDVRLKHARARDPELTPEVQAKLKLALTAGKITYDRDKMSFHLEDHLKFHPVKHGEDPTARFMNEEKAMDQIHHIADCLEALSTAVFYLEGDTATPDEKMGEWSYHLARNRAKLVRDRLMAFGIPKTRLHLVGAPGCLGSGIQEIQFKISDFQ